MTFDEFEQKIRLIRANLIRNRARIALEAAHDLNATVKLRIQEKGEGSTGTQFSPYTPQYARYGRKNKGYQSDYVDFTRTGRMMANIMPQVEKDTEESTKVVITARSASERIKLRGQGRKRGNILQPSKTEIAILEKQYTKKVIDLIESKL